MLDIGETLTPDNAPTLLNGMPASAIRSELERILRSRVFVHSHRIRRFLQFVVEECLLGRQHRLKEYLIGMEVFNRLEAFDPRVDSIVRVEARRLRAKLEEFYLTEGREDELRIELRKGSYVPLFEFRRNGSAGYNYGISPARRKSSIGIAKLTPHNGESPELISEITRRLTHTLINEGCQILAAFDASASRDGDGQAPAATRPDYVLDGTVEQKEEDVKIWLQLTNVADGTYVWSESGKTADLEVLAQSMNRTVVTSYSDCDKRRLNRRAHSQSFDQYLRGRYLWKVLTPETVRSSVALFQKAVERDPSYAAAWAALAEARIFSGFFWSPAGAGERGSNQGGGGTGCGIERFAAGGSCRPGNGSFSPATRLAGWRARISARYSIRRARRQRSCGVCFATGLPGYVAGSEFRVGPRIGVGSRRAVH